MLQPSDPDATDITIAVDPATNSLIVLGSPRAVGRIADLAGQLVGQLPAAPGQVHYIGLPDTLQAATTSRLVNQSLSALTPPGGRRGDLRRRVAVIADQVNNALIVTCNEYDFEIVGDLIAALSQPAMVEEMVVKVYPLQTITADRAAESVRQMLQPDTARGRRGRQAQRMRDLAVTLLSGDRQIEAVFNPSRVRVNVDAQNNALVVMGPPEALGFVDQFVELLDQSRVDVRTTLKLYPLQHAEAADLQNTLRNIFRVRFANIRAQLGSGAIQPEFSADRRTNTLLVTASPEQLREVDVLMEQLDRKLGEDRYPLRMIELTAAQPQQAAQMLDKVVLGSDQQRRTTTLIVPDDTTGTLMVRASEEVMTEIDEVLAEIDRPPTRQFKVRTIVLERADASAVASALQRLFDDRAEIASAGRGRRARSRQISIIGDRNSNTLLIAASDDDFTEIEQLVAHFDTPQAAQALAFRVFQLQHAKANDIASTVQQLIDQISFAEEGPWWAWWGRQQNQGRSRRGTFAINADERLNALIVTGEGDKFEVVESLIAVLDVPAGAGVQRIVRLYPLLHADVDVVADVLNEAFAHGTRYRRWWQEPDPTEARIRTDRRNKVVIVYASRQQQEEIGAFIAGIDEQSQRGEQEMAVLPVEFAQAPELASTLTRFMRDRDRATGGPRSSTTITASRSTNTLIVSAEPAELAAIRDLLAKVDQPDVSGERQIEIIALNDGDAAEIARIVTQQFGRRSGGSGGGGGAGVIVTPDERTNSLVVNAPRAQFVQARALIERLDAPPASDETIIRTYALEGAQAQDVVRILGQTLDLDERGETAGITIRLEDVDGPAVEVKARIVPDRRSNSVIVTATEESFPVIEALIAKIDDVPAASPLEYRIIPLEHALAIDVIFTLRQFLRGRAEPGEIEPRIDYNRIENQLIVAATADQFEQIQKIITELDQPSQNERTTDFIALRFAQAEQVQEALSVFYGPLAFEADTPGKLNTRIVADPASNSLVITADEGEWADIRALLEKLDAQEYDASLQLKVIPLVYADARSVAGAINQAMSAEAQRGRQAPSRGAGRDRDEPTRRADRDAPSVLVEAEAWVRASAEPLTNSVIVSASRQNLRKIETIIAELDVADYAKLPPPQIIPVRTGSPEQLAAALNSLYQQSGDNRGRKALRIVGDPTSNSIIVRAEPEEFRQIQVLAEALQGEADSQGLSVHVLKLHAAPVRRISTAIEQAFRAKATQAGQPLAIEEDVAGNTLIVACTAAMFAEIRDTVRQLDELSPAAGQGIFIIELENISPEAAQNVVETIGLNRPPRDDSVSRLVTEPIRVVPLAGRSAIIVVANPADRDTVVGLFKAIDSEPGLAESELRVVRLRNAEATALARILQEILDPARQQSQTPLAVAVQEQVRRLSVNRLGFEGDLKLDLTKPIRVIADTSLNAIVISSTPDNVTAMAEVVGMFDDLPITDAVEVKLFPLTNIAAVDFRRIVDDLFTQGKHLGGVPGTRVDGVPAGRVGKALLDEVAMSIDERTNTVIVAGKVNAVALVEVLFERIDRDVTNGWIEPRILQLRFADAQDLAETLEAILVDGVMDDGQASPLQRQVARLRLARVRSNGGRVLEADVFTPMSRLVIRAEPKINALVLVGTPMNLEVVTELVGMMDIESAAPGSAVRIYPLEHASAGRVAETITRLFAQQEQAGMIRRDDRVIVQPDDRTNSIVVTTSKSSFAVVEGLLRTLDTGVPPELAALQRLDLDNASATRVGAMVAELMDARLERLRRTEPETAELQRATIVADTRTNSLVVAAGRESFEVVQALVEDLDRAALSEDALIRVITVTNGNVDRIAETVNVLMERRYADMPQELRRSQQPLLLTDMRSNSLLVAAGPDDLAAITQLVEQLEEAPSNPAIRLAVIPLKGSAADRLAPRIQTLMRQRQQSLGAAGQPSDRVSVEPDTATNSLIVAASEENLQVIHDLIGALSGGEKDRPPGSDLEIVQLVSSTATEVVDLLDDLYVDDANRRRGRDTVRVTADDRLNAVLISAPSDDVRAIKELVAQLDGLKPSQVVEIRYIPLMSANALETVGLIENVLSGRGLGTRRTSRQAIVIKYFHQYVADMGNGDPQLSEMEVSAAIRESITLTPDLRTNTVIVSAPAAAMSMIERMVRDLDQSSVGSQNVRIFKLKNADALAMAEILTDLFNLQRRGNLYVLKPREPAQSGILPAGSVPTPVAANSSVVQLLGSELTAVPDDRQDLSITVDNRTNSLLCSGTPLYLDLVEEVVDNLDALEANEREVFAYPLRNAVASEVASVLTAFVDQEQQKLLSTLSPDQLGSASRLLEREVTIVGDEKSNTVLVSASPRYLDRVRQMIVELDIDPPQVLIQVLLAEISLDGSLEWGVDARFQSNEFGSQNVIIAGSSSLASAFLPTLGIPSFSVSGDNFTLLLKALESQGRIQVLSNPSVMAANNQPAHIQIGENIGRASSSSLSDGGTQQTTVEFLDIGVILNVTPSINPDGFVRMTIEPEITDLTNESIQVSEDLSVPILTKRTAATTVTVRDGQTIVIGGLIQDLYEIRKNKVPILGDIPLLGLLFRSEFEESRKIELLIVLTPHVITSPSQFARVDELTDREIGRMSVSPEEKKMLENSFLVPEKRTWKQRIQEDMKRKWERTPPESQSGEGEAGDAESADDNSVQTKPEQAESTTPLTTYEEDRNRQVDE